jgi:hypothetical protein
MIKLTFNLCIFTYLCILIFLAIKIVDTIHIDYITKYIFISICIFYLMPNFKMNINNMECTLDD